MCDSQRWAPSTYNLRPLGVSLGISGHRTDLVQEISEPDRLRAQAEREFTYAGSRLRSGAWQSVRVGLGVSNTRPILERVSGLECNLKCSANIIIKLVHITMNAKNTMKISPSIV